MYTKEQIDRFTKLANELDEKIAKRDFLTANYKDVPVLKELDSILNERKDEEKETLSFAYEGFSYLADKYTGLGRFAISQKYNQAALDMGILLFKKYEYRPEGVEEVLSNLLRDRNYYVDDDCKDVLKALKGVALFEEKELKRIFDRRMAHRRNLKHDPVEMTQEYLDVIDEVEEKIEKNRSSYRGMGSCYEVWDLKARFLLEKGIKWKSPSMMNPRVIFD